jgi:hypothetical protein
MAKNPRKPWPFMYSSKRHTPPLNHNKNHLMEKPGTTHRPTRTQILVAKFFKLQTSAYFPNVSSIELFNTAVTLLDPAGCYFTGSNWFFFTI